MIAPDKIYLHGYVFDKRPCDRWDAEPTPKKMFGYEAKFVEYIRKDALLDWLKECKENPVITDLQKGNIQEMIEKIESL